MTMALAKECTTRLQEPSVGAAPVHEHQPSKSTLDKSILVHVSQRSTNLNELGGMY
jgi:hypothetical protein